ncbi:unnamed protein product [Symbiodinium necroappetens]|uniref:Uncharacterized protein n=1 Tax=Symbiodinium necroappetens TaxID=1628268 RepID=A0A813BCE9_9DINO|nr:unnamed protein product [Symbiodinium necroappetens]
MSGGCLCSAVQRRLTGAVPESDRPGVYGYVERLCAVWHGCLGSFAVGVLILLDLGRHMRDDYALTTLSGKPVEKGAVILARPGTLDQEDADLSRCLAMMQEDLLVVAGEFFGMRNLVLFMSGAILFGIGLQLTLRFSRVRVSVLGCFFGVALCCHCGESRIQVRYRHAQECITSPR